MSALTSAYSHLNYTHSGESSSGSWHLCSNPQTSKNFSGLNLNFTPSFTATVDSSTKMFDGRKLNYKFTVPGNLQLTTGSVFQKALSSPPPFAGRIDAEGEESTDQALLSPLVISGAEVIADFSGHIRQTFASSNTVYGTENPAALAALGFTTGFSLVSGSLNVRSGIKEIKTADKISDTAGKVLAGLKIVKGGVFAAAGAIFIPVRALSIAALSTTAKIVSTMAGVLGSLGSALFSIGSLFAGISLGIRLNEHRQFRQELEAILKDPNLSEEARPAAALGHLKKLASVGPEEKAEILTELEKDPEYRVLSPEQQTEKASLKEKLLLQRKEAFLKRVTSDECLKMIRQKGPSEAGEVIASVQKKSLEKVIVSSIAIGLVGISLALTAASFVFTGPLAIILTTAIGLAVSLSWILVDAYGLIQEFKNSEPGRFDKLWILLSTVVAAIAVGLVFFLSGGIAPIIAASVVGLVWLAINITSYYRLYQLEKKKEAAQQ